MDTPREPATGIFRGELTAGTVIGKCRIEKVLGRGGMGVVYLARHLTLDSAVAVKIMPPDVAVRRPDFAERFLREAKVAAQLKHPNVVAVMDADRDGGTGLYYIVTEYMDGGSVGDRLKKGPLSESKATAILTAMLRALGVAARQHIVHRDIKPDNILLSKDGRVKMADLGLAKRTDELGVTTETGSFGTPHYMSPEQFQDSRNVDGRSDLYSLGATYFHLLTGTTPFSGDRVYEVMQKAMNAPVPDPRERVPAISEAAARVCMKLMAKEPRLRYQTPEEALEDMQRGNGPILELEATAGVEKPSGIAPPTKIEPPPAPPTLSDLTPQVATALKRQLKSIKPSWIVAGCALILLALVARMTLKSREEPSPDPIQLKQDVGGTKPVDPPVIPRAGFTLADGAVLALSFEPETIIVQDGHSGYRDLSAWKIDGQLVMATVTGAEATPAKVGTGLRLGGPGQLVSLPGYRIRSVAAWLQPAENSRPAFWLDGGGQSRLTGFMLGIARPGHFGWPIDSEAAVLGFWQMDVLVPSKGLGSGWHHFVASWDGDREVRIMIDGRLPDGFVTTRGPGRPAPVTQPFSLPEKPSPSQQPLYIGGTHIAGNPSLGEFRGVIDELAIWDRALSESEMRSLYDFAARGESYCEKIQKAKAE